MSEANNPPIPRRTYLVGMSEGSVEDLGERTVCQGISTKASSLLAGIGGTP